MGLAAHVPNPLARLTRSTELRRLEHLVGAWRRERRGGRYVDELKTWLTSVRSDATRRSYSAAVGELFDYLKVTTGRFPLPDQVTRAHTFEFVRYLGTRTIGLEAHRLERDPERHFDAVVYEFLLLHPGSHIADIGRALILGGVPQAELDVDALASHLAGLVLRNLLERKPTLRDVRSGRVSVGRELKPARAQLDYRVDPNIFAYSVARHGAPDAAARSGSIKTRVRALASFWSFMMETGENTPGAEALLRHNVWLPAARQLQSQAAAQAAVTRARKTPTLHLFNRLLGTTYRASEGGEAVVSDAFDDVRDRALLLLFLYTGARDVEVARLRRRDVEWSHEPTVTLHGKGDKLRVVRLPTPCYAALLDLTVKLEQLAAAEEARRPGQIAKARQLLNPDAPLLPPIKRWGASVSGPQPLPELGAQLAALTTSAIAKVLRRRAVAAGIEPGTADFARVHAHGLRALAAQLARDMGTPLPVIQKVLGHSSVATTSLYTEVRDPRATILFGWAPPTVPGTTATSLAPAMHSGEPAVIPIAPSSPSASHVPAPRVIEAVGVPIPETKEMPFRGVAAAVHPEERLVAVGATPDVVVELAHIYETRWGEEGDRRLLRATGKGAPR